MHRFQSSCFEHHAPVPAAGLASFHVVLPTGGRDGRESAADASDRRAVFEETVLRKPKDGTGARMQSQADATIDAFDGPGGHLPETTDHVAGRRTQDLPIFTAKCADHAVRSGLEHRYHVRPDATRLSVFGGSDRLVQPLRVGLAAVQYAARHFLFGGVGGSARRRSARDFQHRSGLAIHGQRVYVTTGGPRGRREHGRSWPSIGQRLHRTVMAEREIRRGVSERLRRWLAGSDSAAGLLRILRKRATAPGPRLQDTAGGILCRKINKNRRTRILLVGRVNEDAFSRPIRGDSLQRQRSTRGRGPLAAKPHIVHLNQPSWLSKHWGPLHLTNKLNFWH